MGKINESNMKSGEVEDFISIIREETDELK